MARIVALIPASTPLVQEHLADLHCPCGRDHDFVFSPQCHLDAPVMASYDRKTGKLLMTCAVCNAPVATVSVAKADDASQMGMVN